jgi:hypothetical protein
MLGYVTTSGRGESDRLLFAVAQRLLVEGWPLAGVVQVNAERLDGMPCDMELHVLAAGHVVRISQRLGRHAQGCRLDSSGLEEAVGLVAAALGAEGASKPRLLIVNKFGKQEMDGRGFRPVMAEALALGIPVLTAVNAGSIASFQAFAEGLAAPVEPEAKAVLDWCRRIAAPA